MTSMEDLNKTQLVLLVLLVTFVTSIATAIITTSLLAEAPVGVTQTINRVVERTIETVVQPADTNTKDAPLSKENEALVATLKSASQAIVRVGEVKGTTSPPAVISMGVIMAQEGLVVSRRGNISLSSTSTASYVAILSDDTILPLFLITAGEFDDVAVFKIATTTRAQ
jgi:hypothetical protein